MRDLTVGDEIYGTRLDGKCRYYTRTRVLDHWKTLRVAFRVTLAHGTEIVASGDHRFLHRIRETRGGEKLYDARFGVRGRGVGAYAETIAQLFDTTVKRLGLNERERPEPRNTFRRPPKGGQLSLF